MSGLVNKVKEAVTGHHKDTTGTDLEHEHGSQSGVHDKPHSGSVAHGDSVSSTNPGVLHSTKPGIHGERDSGVSGSGLSNNELTGQGSGMTGSHSGSVAYGDSISPTNPGVLHSTKPGVHGPRDAGTGGSGLSNADLRQDEGVGSELTSGSRSGYDSTPGTGTGTGGHGPHSSALGNKADPRIDSDRDGSRNLGATGSNLGGSGSAGPQYTGTTKRDEGLIGSGVDTAGSGQGLTGSDTRDSGLTGRGLGGTGSSTGSGLTDHHSGHEAGLTSGTTGTGSGLTGHQSGHDSGLTGGTTGIGSGLTGNRSEYDSGVTGGSSGLTGGTTDSGVTGHHSGHHTGSSGLTGGSTTGGEGLVGKAERMVEGSGKHHPGDGHPEDIVHPGPHVTGTAKALDPHLND